MFPWNSVNSTLCLSLQRTHLFFGEMTAGRRCGILSEVLVLVKGFHCWHQVPQNIWTILEWPRMYTFLQLCPEPDQSQICLSTQRKHSWNFKRPQEQCFTGWFPSDQQIGPQGFLPYNCTCAIRNFSLWLVCIATLQSQPSFPTAVSQPLAHLLCSIPFDQNPPSN